MVIEIPSGAQASAFFRHIASSAVTVVGVFALFANLTPEQQQAITHAIQQITDGAQSIIAGVSTLGPIVMGLYAVWKSRTAAVVQVINKNPDLDVVPLTQKGVEIIQEVKTKENTP